MSSVCAVVVAGGCGARFGNPGGKQLVNVAGKPLMTWSIRAFDRSAFVSHIVVVCPAEKMDEMRRQAIDPYNFATPITFAEAGKTRQDSTRSGVEAVPEGYEYVAIHDAARPLITEKIIAEAVEAAMRDSAAAPGVACKDSIQVIQNGKMVKNIARESVIAVQTPQCFDIDLICAALTKALESGESLTDDCGAVTALGQPITITRGSYENIKITTPEDVVQGEAILKGRRQK